ncbi:MMPL family transporter [Asanoa sp. WMMD1127]|uniref:MMPL family transporter n=1 Tax=Asanoa sp. WMMD1127 TaxID=3016107 RepID=UPI002416B5BD|nr:MMPL family transporter [Asanoa sp. WMMD1127]MDG4821723.1 MMPL family transporter [Asanoa sp. WMMD1127]
MRPAVARPPSSARRTPGRPDRFKLNFRSLDRPRAWAARRDLGMHAFLARLGRTCARHHWVVIGAWLVLVVGLAVGNNRWGGDYLNNYTVPGSQSDQGTQIIASSFPGQSTYVGQLVFQSPAGSTVAERQSAVDEAVANTGRLPHVVSATSPFATNPPTVSPDGTIAYATVDYDISTDTLGQSYLDQLDSAVAPARAAGLTVDYGAATGQIGKGTSDLPSEVVGIVVAFVLLFFIFFSVVAALIPLVSAVFSVLGALSIIGLLAAVVTFPTTGPTLATLLGLGVAIDYGLFQVARHREDLADGDDYTASAAVANSHSGMAILVAGSTVIIAMLGLYIAGLPFISALGVSAALGVAMTMLAALTLIPAFLGLAGRTVRAMRFRRRSSGGVGAPPAPPHPRRNGTSAGQSNLGAAPDGFAPPEPRPPGGRADPITHPAHENGAFARWGRYVSRRPWPWAVAAVVALLVITIPLLWIDFGQLDPGTDPTSDSDRRAYDLIAEGFGPGANGPLTVVVQLPAGSDPTTVLTSAQLALEQQPGVASVTQPLVDPSGSAAIINVVPTTGPREDATTDLLHRIRDDVLPTVAAPTYVTGQTAGYDDFTARTVERLPWLIFAVVVLSLLLLTTAFRSLVIGIQAALMNLLSVGAAYGVIVAVFQWGWASSLIGVDMHLPIPAYVPMIMFAVVFGLSMDYEVFLMSRVHEAYLHTRDTRRSVALGIGATARVITTAALIMIVVFISFVADPDPTIKMLAVGMAVSVLLDASIVRMILVPAILAILGDRAWWIPRWLDRILPRLDIEGDQPPPKPELQGARR